MDSDREGTDETKTEKVESTNSQATINLSEHFLNDINTLSQTLRNHGSKCVGTKENNSNELKTVIEKLKNYKKMLIECIDQEINKLVKMVCL